MAPLTKDYPVFDCDSHVNELPEAWNYLSVKEKEMVKPYLWPEGSFFVLNGTQKIPAYWDYGRSGVNWGLRNPKPRIPSSVAATGPGVNKKIIRKLRTMDLSEEQCQYTDHKGAIDPRARMADMDLQGIDQVAVIPVLFFQGFLFIENIEAAALLARAYNDWIYDWCSVNPQRLFPCAALPVQDPTLAAKELERVAARGFRVAALRAVDIKSSYPNQAMYEPMWRAFEETGMVVGMHALPGVRFPKIEESQGPWAASFFLDKVINAKQMYGPGGSLGFVHEAMTWITNVLLSGFLERHPKLTLAIMESNSTWLPMVLEECDRAYRLYKNQRRIEVARQPSSIFQEQCFIAFEGDEEGVYKQHALYENIGIWSSDVYHHDGADAWEAIRRMNKLGVPQAAQAKILGGNANRMYRIEPKMFTTTAPASYPRPDWYPKTEEIEREYASLMRVS